MSRIQLVDLPLLQDMGEEQVSSVYGGATVEQQRIQVQIEMMKYALQTQFAKTGNASLSAQIASLSKQLPPPTKSTAVAPSAAQAMQLKANMEAMLKQQSAIYRRR